MGKCYITRRGTKTSGTTEQLGVYPTGEDGRPTGDVTVLDNVITLSEYLFKNNSNITTVTLPDNLQTISDYSFQNCVSLTNVTLGEKSNYSLGKYAFSNCSTLTNNSVHDIMEHCSTVSTNVFRECNGLTNVEVSRFWTDMFTNCTNLITAKSLIGKNTGDDVFYGCKKLKEVYIADGTTTIGQRVFYKCTSLKTVYLPSSIIKDSSSGLTSTSGSYYVFQNCTALEDVQLGQDWNMSLRLNVSNNLTVDSMVAMFNSLKDLTGETAKTLTLGETNLAKLTDEQKAIAINKNWTLA